ncbi:MAG: hypothetical protein KAT68_07095 [Bacteroidales bacterium]|nr:hypothetical protein [Bacteroidales bacterium]
MKRIYLIIITVIILITSFGVHAQTDFEKYLQHRDSVYNDYVNKSTDGYKNFKDSIDNEFAQYRDSINKAFAQFLKQSWESHTLKENKLVIPVKPETPPVFDPNKQTPPVKIEPKSTPIKIYEEPQLPIDDFSNRINKELKEKLAEYYKTASHKDQFDFYGGKINIFYDDMNFNILSINNQTVSQAWKQLSQKNYLPVIDQLAQYAHEYNLNDWGYMLLIKELGNKLYNNNNKTTLFTWFVLANTGYVNVKAGHLNNKLYLLVPSSMDIYSTYYFTNDNYKLYVFDLDNIRNSVKGISYAENSPKVSTYNNKFYNEKTKEFNFFQTEQLDFNKHTQAKQLGFMYNAKYTTFNLMYDAQAVDFYNDFPPCESEVYFTSKLSKSALESIKKQFKPMLEGKTKSQQVQFLLTFTQKAFNYQIDQKQFGYERWLYPEEIIKYAYSDCEDRSSFFAQLVNYFTDLKVIGLIYTNHIATAVCFGDKNIVGNYLEYKGYKYFICDPTFIGANIGNCMPKLARVSPKIIDFASLTK